MWMCYLQIVIYLFIYLFRWAVSQKPKWSIKLSDPFFAAAEQSERKLNLHIKIPLGKQSAFRDATIGFAAQWRQRNERRDSILMMRHYSDLGSATDWLKQISLAARPIRSATQTSFRGESSDGVAKRLLFSQALQKRWTVICTSMWKSRQMYRLFFFLFRVSCSQQMTYQRPIEGFEDDRKKKKMWIWIRLNASIK